MFVPFEAGGVLVKNPDHLRSTFSTIPDYLKSDQSDEPRTDLMEYNLPLTKEFKALKVWMTLKAYGARRISEIIKEDIDKAKYLVGKIKKDPCLNLMAPAPLSIVCFRYLPPGAVLSERELNELNDAIIHRIEQDGRVFLTGTKIDRETAMRVCFINHRTENSHIDELVDVVLEIGEEISG
jgi:glutamate/tyrosine decarboxylase-like PLP-dependent enzyme